MRTHSHPYNPLAEHITIPVRGCISVADGVSRVFSNPSKGCTKENRVRASGAGRRSAGIGSEDVIPVCSQGEWRGRDVFGAGREASRGGGRWIISQVIVHDLIYGKNIAILLSI